MAKQDIIATISSLKNKNSNGYDNILNKILKMICSEIAKPLSLNQMFTTGFFPDSLKVAKITSKAETQMSYRTIAQYLC